MLLAALVVLAAGFDIAVPFITQQLIDTLVEYFRKPAGNLLPALLTASAAILAATVLNRIIKSTYDYHLFKTVTQIDDGLRYAATDKYLSMHALFHFRSHSGQIIGRIERGCTGVFTILLDVFGQNLLPPLIVLAGVLVSLAFKNLWIALIVALPLPVYLVVIQRLTERIYVIERKVNEQFEAVSKETYDVAGNVLTVKKFSRERAEALHQKMLLERARETQFGVLRLWMVLENTQTLIATLGRVGVIVVAGLLVLRGRASVGEFVLYVTLQNMAYAPVSQLSVIFPRLRRNLAAAERIFALLDEPNRILDKPDARDLTPLRHSIEFRDVWFRYSETGRWVLKGVSVIIPAGSTVALVGRSGSGKTTFVNLLLRSFDPQRGAILVDGTDIRDVTQESLRRQAAVVPQEVDLFSRSIAENISYGKPGASRQEIEQAARTALAHDFILATEEGYDTTVGERGLKLSGGERQRIGIARAVLRDPRILILDEATSHLDTESERLIQQATDNLTRGRTALIIAHRLSTILNAGIILVFNDGVIEAAGTHEELLRESPVYRRLYSSQFGGAAPVEPQPLEPQEEPVAM